MNYIITFLISMIPLVELRGAVPYAISSGIPLWQALLIGGHWQHASCPYYLLFRSPYPGMGER